MFKNALVRKPGKSMVHGLTSAKLGTPDYLNALSQHQAYCQALTRCGLRVTLLEAEEAFPDSTFVEDTAILTPHCAILTNPGASSRRREVAAIKPAVARFYSQIEEIRAPGTLEGGDVMMVGDHYYIGLSTRTNDEGARQLIQILDRYGLTGSIIHLEKGLHLKTGLSYLENNNMLACGEFLGEPAFTAFTKIKVPEAERYAANCIWVNDTVIAPQGYPVTRQLLEKSGYSVIGVEMTEFQKLDGGLSCLSLRF